LKVVILAGGVGTRLWPESRQRRPKQLLSLVGGRSMLQETVDRVLPLVPASDVFVVTAGAYVAAVAKQLPGVPRSNVIGEPMGRGSAPAMGLAATYLAGGRDDVLAFLPADHAIAKPETFRQGLSAAEGLAREGYLVTLGIRPSAPFTGYGYIQQVAWRPFAWRGSRRSPIRLRRPPTTAADCTPGTPECSLPVPGHC
jgi:mannose-1-phosphate guanylyltransferase